MHAMAHLTAIMWTATVMQPHLPSPDVVHAVFALILAPHLAHSEGVGCFCAQGVEHNSEAALYAVSQGRGRSAGCATWTAAETIAAQRCLRNPACSKALGHAGFCDNGKSVSATRHNSLAGLAAAAEQASNGSTGSTTFLAAFITNYITIDQCGTPEQCKAAVSAMLR